MPIARIFCSAAFALAIPVFAHAQSTMSNVPYARYFDDRWYLTPFATYVLADKDRFANSGWGGGLAVGKPVHPRWDLEFRTQYEELGAQTGGPGKYKNWSGSFDVHWYFVPRDSVRSWQPDTVQPYLIAGIGLINDKVSGSLTTPSGNTTSFMWNAGIGFAWPFATWGRLIGDVRYRWDDNRGGYGDGTNFGDVLFTVGLQIPLGEPPRTATPPRAGDVAPRTEPEVRSAATSAPAAARYVPVAAQEGVRAVRSYIDPVVPGTVVQTALNRDASVKPN